MGNGLLVICDAPSRDAHRVAFAQVVVRGRSAGPDPVEDVTARVGTVEVALALEPEPSGGVRFAGTVPTDGLPRGVQTLTLTARDVTGRVAVALTEVDVQPLPPTPSDEPWASRVARGEPVVGLDTCRPGPPRPGWPAPTALEGFAFCTQGLASLRVIVDGTHEVTPFHGLYRPELAGPLGSRAAVACGFRAELLDPDWALEGRDLVVLATAPDGRVGAWRGPLERTPDEPSPAAVAPAVTAVPARRRAPGASIAGVPAPGPDGWRRLAEEWAERAIRAEARAEAAATDLAWSGLQTRLALEHAAEAALGRAAAAAARPAVVAQGVAFARVDDPLVSIVVTTFDRADLLARCLGALARTLGAVPAEVIVVLDGENPTVGAVAAAADGVRVVRPPSRAGYLRSANAGAAAARGTHLVHLNDDTEPQPGWLDALLRRLDEADVGVVVPRLLHPDGRLQEAGSLIWSDGGGHHLGSGGDETDPAHAVARDVDYGSAAAMLVRGELWRALGGFDERFVPGYYEDVDLCFAARERGQRVVYEPTSRVVHVGGGSMGPGALDITRTLVERHQRTFCDKWAAALAEQPPRAPQDADVLADRRLRLTLRTGP